MEKNHPTPYTLHPTPNLVLIGFMGTGKSTLGRLCAARMGYRFCDSDQVIAAQAGCTIPELFRTQGEARFRAWEKDVIAELADTPGLVIATGGGAVLEAANAACLRATGFVVLLTAAPDVILRRTGYGRTRPLLANAPDPRARIEELLAQRLPTYQRVAHCQVETDAHPVRDIAQHIVHLYDLASGEVGTTENPEGRARQEFL